MPSRKKMKSKHMRCCTWGGEGWQKRAERSGFALIFFGSFLHQGKKEQDKRWKLFDKDKRF